MTEGSGTMDSGTFLLGHQFAIVLDAQKIERCYENDVLSDRLLKTASRFCAGVMNK